MLNMSKRKRKVNNKNNKGKDQFITVNRKPLNADEIFFSVRRGVFVILKTESHPQNIYYVERIYLNDEEPERTICSLMPAFPDGQKSSETHVFPLSKISYSFPTYDYAKQAVESFNFPVYSDDKDKDLKMKNTSFDPYQVYIDEEEEQEYEQEMLDFEEEDDFPQNNEYDEGEFNTSDFEKKIEENDEDLDDKDLDDEEDGEFLSDEEPLHEEMIVDSRNPFTNEEDRHLVKSGGFLSYEESELDPPRDIESAIGGHDEIRYDEVIMKVADRLSFIEGQIDLILQRELSVDSNRVFTGKPFSERIPYRIDELIYQLSVSVDQKEKDEIINKLISNLLLYLATRA